MRLVFLDKNTKVLKNIFKIIFFTRKVWTYKKYYKYTLKHGKVEPIYHIPPHSLFIKNGDTWHKKLNQ
jgi:hypothetical protein